METFGRAFGNAVADENPAGIIQDVDSRGGMMLANLFFKVIDEPPVRATPLDDNPLQDDKAIILTSLPKPFCKCTTVNPHEASRLALETVNTERKN